MKQVITALLATMFIACLESKFPLWATILIAVIYILLHWLFNSKTFKHQYAMSKARQERKHQVKVSEKAIQDAVMINEQRTKEELERQAELLRKK